MRQRVKDWLLVEIAAIGNRQVVAKFSFVVDLKPQ